MAPVWKQYLEAGMQVTEMTRSQARRLVQQLVHEGQVAQGRAKGYVDDLVEQSRKRTEALTALIRREIKQQLSALGLVTKDDLAKLEKKLTKKIDTVGATTSSSKRSGGSSRKSSTKRSKTSKSSKKSS